MAMDALITDETTLGAARRLGSETACLVFASARKPGGGFLTGAQAQEESLARSPASHACLRAVPELYTFHRNQPDLRYSDRVIYSPSVPVFRDDDGTLLPRPVNVSFLTAAAPNLAALTASQPEDAVTVPAVLHARVARVLQSAAAHRHRQLVLGVWAAASSATTPPSSQPPSPKRSARPGGSTTSSSPSMTASPEPRSTGHSPPPSPRSSCGNPTVIAVKISTTATSITQRDWTRDIAARRRLDLYAAVSWECSGADTEWVFGAVRAAQETGPAGWLRPAWGMTGGQAA